MSSPSGQSPPPFPPEFLAEDCRDGPRIGIWASMGVAVVVIALRVYARVGLLKNFGLDDTLIVMAGVSLSWSPPAKPRHSLQILFFSTHSKLTGRT